jgi:hypothetical protein
VDATQETWKPVVGYEGLYEVSNAGRVRSIPRRVNFGPSSRLSPQTILRPRTIPSGHQTVSIYKDRKRKTAKVHRLVLEAFVGPAPEGMECCHNNGIASDNRVENLRWDTASANRRDCVNHGNNLNAAKTHCVRGHPLTPDNVYTKALPARVCKTCARIRSKKKSAERKRASQ